MLSSNLSSLAFFVTIFPLLACASAALPWGDINIFVVTDVHSWIAGHGRHERSDADYGDVLSFYETMQRQNPDRDIFFVMNGDFMDGTGLSTIPPSHLLPILRRMPWDAVNMGNHELYFNETIQYMVESGFIRHWKGNYLTSNTRWAAKLSSTDDTVTDQTSARLVASHSARRALAKQKVGAPIGQYFTYLWASQSKTRILTFGFLFNFRDNCKLSNVVDVEKVVRELWFIRVLEQQDDYDAILVLAHMDYLDPLVSVIQTAMREIVGPDMPIQFINGHSHRRGFCTMDETSAAMEAGKYLDTVGFVSFPLKETVMDVGLNASSSLFKHEFIDTTVEELKSVVGEDTKMETTNGKALKTLIRETRNKLGLNEKISRVPQTYYLNGPLNESQSLWRLYLEEVIPSQLTGYNTSKVYFQTTGGFRYDLFQGETTMDDAIAVTPFNDTVFRLVEGVSGTDLQQLVEAVANISNAKSQTLPSVVSTVGRKDTIFPQEQYDIYSVDFNVELLCGFLGRILTHPNAPRCQPVRMYNTCNMGDETVVTEMTTLTLWVNFLRETWPHEAAAGNAQKRHRTNWAPWFFLGAFLALVIGLVQKFSRTHNTQRVTELANETTPLL